jgi:hypothetical protein
MEILFCAFKSASVQPAQGHDVESDFGRDLASVFDPREHRSVSSPLLSLTMRLDAIVQAIRRALPSVTVHPMTINSAAEN